MLARVRVVLHKVLQLHDLQPVSGLQLGDDAAEAVVALLRLGSALDLQRVLCFHTPLQQDLEFLRGKVANRAVSIVPAGFVEVIGGGVRGRAFLRQRTRASILAALKLHGRNPSCNGLINTSQAHIHASAYAFSCYQAAITDSAMLWGASTRQLHLGVLTQQVINEPPAIKMQA